MPAKTGKLVKSRQRLGLSGLGGTKRLKARTLAVRACRFALARKAGMNYTQGPRRWQGISEHLVPWGSRPNRPAYADCSSSSTWVLWAVLAHHFGLKPDIVNGQSWKAGYTGTMISRGVRVKHRVNWRRGDLIFYGDPFGRTGHVVVYLGRGRVFSFGSQGGPYELPWNYRSDFHSCRRYI